MGRDHEMTGAGNGHKRGSRDCVAQQLGDALNGRMTAFASHEKAWHSDPRVGSKRYIERPRRRPVKNVRRRGGNNVLPGPSWERIKASVAAVESKDAPCSQQLAVVTRADISVGH